MNVLGLELKTVYLLRVYTYRGPGGSGKDAGVTAVSRTEVVRHEWSGWLGTASAAFSRCGGKPRSSSCSSPARKQSP